MWHALQMRNAHKILSDTQGKNNSVDLSVDVTILKFLYLKIIAGDNVNWNHSTHVCI
jgi:hypothetical protein